MGILWEPKCNKSYGNKTPQKFDNPILVLLSLSSLILLNFLLAIFYFTVLLLNELM